VDNSFYLSPEMILSATKLDKDFDLLPEFLIHKASLYLSSLGIYDLDDDIYIECLIHLSPESFDEKTANVIKLVRAIGEWEKARISKFGLENSVVSIIAYAIAASDMAHYEITASEVQRTQTELKEFIVNKEDHRNKVVAGMKESESVNRRKENDRLILEEYKKINSMKNPPQQRDIASLIAKRVGLNRDTVKRKLNKLLK
jgi:hypothetical protein